MRKVVSPCACVFYARLCVPACLYRVAAITGDHSKKDQILLVKLAKYVPGRFLCVS